MKVILRRPLYLVYLRIGIYKSYEREIKEVNSLL